MNLNTAAGQTVKYKGQAKSLLKKIDSNAKLTSSDIKNLRKLSSNLKGTSKWVRKGDSNFAKISKLAKSKDFSKDALQKILKEERRIDALNKPTPTPKISDVKSGTEDYLSEIEKIRKSDSDRYTTLLDKQTASFDKQLKSQSDTLSKQLSDLTTQSKSQVENYKNLIAGITSRQENKLTSMREMFASQNKQSEAVISGLQASIDRLSIGNAPPVIDVDTSPAVIGVNKFQEQSRQRQMLGTRGTRQSRSQTGALGLAIGV